MSQTVHDYLLMSGYASFIWPAYGVAALVLSSFAVDSWRRARKAALELRRLESAATKQVSPTGTGRDPQQQAGL